MGSVLLSLSFPADGDLLEALREVQKPGSLHPLVPRTGLEGFGTPCVLGCRLGLGLLGKLI